MFCFQCQETAGNKGCTKVGVCGKDENTANSQDLLIYVTKGLAEVLNKLENVDSKYYDLISNNMFVTIDKDEQLKRFKDRQRNPDKQYKITDEDWRNREKWDQYIDSMNEMLERTNSNYAPWIIVEGNSKKYARIKVMEEYIKVAKAHLKKLEDKK